MTTIIYRLFLEFYYYTAIVFAFFSPKADAWLAGQRQTWLHLQKTARNTHRPTLWIHCASLGEFEQARPIIESVKTQHPLARIILTFFSPSGYEIRKNYALADEVHYLPLDTPSNVQLWLTQKQPTIAIFVKYEFWHYYLQALQQNNIPTYLIAANFRPDQVFFKWYGALFRDMLRFFSKIFVQNEQSKQLLNAIGVSSEVCFDTRFDRVFEIAQQRKTFSQIELFKAGQPIIVAGSTWAKDEELLAQVINGQVAKGYKYIIAPHQIEPVRIVQLKTKLAVNAVLFSELSEYNALAAQVIIVDHIGSLSSIYAYADIAYVGGGFNVSVHNVLEAAVYGVPVLFGPAIQKSEEAKALKVFDVADIQ
ncbi:MAG TPA: glycosyltransferase N-terminal domain-containing protein, partial [Chitinophagales bacterium]|nr:glycosyltransferase N-terminal domain-containing protein [Chitinophagales bacterium]